MGERGGQREGEERREQAERRGGQGLGRRGAGLREEREGGRRREKEAGRGRRGAGQKEEGRESRAEVTGREAQEQKRWEMEAER